MYKIGWCIQQIELKYPLKICVYTTGFFLKTNIKFYPYGIGNRKIRVKIDRKYFEIPALFLSSEWGKIALERVSKTTIHNIISEKFIRTFRRK